MRLWQQRQLQIKPDCAPRGESVFHAVRDRLYLSYKQSFRAGLLVGGDIFGKAIDRSQNAQ